MHRPRAIGCFCGQLKQTSLLTGFARGRSDRSIASGSHKRSGPSPKASHAPTCCMGAIGRLPHVGLSGGAETFMRIKVPWLPAGKSRSVRGPPDLSIARTSQWDSVIAWRCRPLRMGSLNDTRLCAVNHFVMPSDGTHQNRSPSFRVHCLA
jgi:hypothetical protein